VITEICKKLRTLKSALICTHIAPDSDAIGSSCALWLILNKLNINAKVYLSCELPEYLRPLTTQIEFCYEIPKTKVDAVIGLDTSNKERLGEKYKELLLSADMIFNIDHHISNTNWGQFNHVEAEASSTAEIVFFIAEHFKHGHDSALSNLLFAGLADDTGCFRYTNTTARSLEVAKRLVELGGSPSEVANAIYFSIPERVIRLRTAALSTLKTSLNGELASIYVDLQMLNSLGAAVEDSERLVDDARSIKGTIGVFFMRETKPDVWKFSLRSKDLRLDVNKLAQEFGGGGHRVF